MKAFTKFTVLSSALVLTLAATACNDDGVDDDDNIGGSNTGGSGNNTGGNNTGGNNVGGSNTGGDNMGGFGGDANALPTILETAAEDPDLSVFVEAVDKADLADVVNANNRTVFVPNNAAFTALLASLGLGTLADLSPEQLRPILRYHVLGSVVDSEAALALAEEGDKVASLGGTFELSVDGDDLLVDEATVIDADIEASNGLIHIIDAVLLPSITDIVTTDSTFTGLRTLIAAADAGSGVPAIGATLDGSSPFGQWLLFAPNNAAIAGLTFVPEDQALNNAILYHTVPTATPPTSTIALTYDEESFATSYFLHSIIVDGGTSVTVQDEDDESPDATVTIADLYAENGIIHVIDEVLVHD